MTNESNEYPIRSFVRRNRITARQGQALEHFWPTFGLTVANGPLDPIQAFSRSAKLVFEIGFGMGDSLISMATAHPEIDYLATEVHRPGVGALLAAIADAGIENIRIYQEDAISVLTHCIKNKNIDAIQIFFPDPWPKRNHHKRRLIQPSFLDLITPKLKPSGHLHLATDWEDYAKHMMKVLTAHAGFENAAGEGQFLKNAPLRPTTKFERRALRLGHPIWELLFLKI